MKDSVTAYDQLAAAVRPYNITPLFRKEQGGKQLIYLVQSPTVPKLSSNMLISVVLFIATFFSMMLMGVDIPPEQISSDEFSTLQLLFRNIFTGWPFAVSMMGILFAHEMGHYVMCRYYNVPATLPFFIPAPLISPLGTLGAFIAMRGIPKNKRVLFDVGVAGPLAGVVIAIPVSVHWVVSFASGCDRTRRAWHLRFAGREFDLLFVFQVHYVRQAAA